jgi:hypothetical protein
VGSENLSAADRVTGESAASSAGSKLHAGTRRALRRAMWKNFLAAGLLLQAQGCFFDWEAAVESGLLALTTSVSTNVVQFLLTDLIPGDLELRF